MKKKPFEPTSLTIYNFTPERTSRLLLDILIESINLAYKIEVPNSDTNKKKLMARLELIQDWITDQECIRTLVKNLRKREGK